MPAEHQGNRLPCAEPQLSGRWDTWPGLPGSWADTAEAALTLTPGKGSGEGAAPPRGPPHGSRDQPGGQVGPEGPEVVTSPRPWRAGRQRL